MRRIDNISAIDGMEGHEFEYFCANVLRQVGFTDVNVTPGSGDQGVDIVATKDGIKYAIQCKNYAKPLSNTPVQEVSAGKMFYNCHVGVVMTNSTFTPGAIQLANATNVLLWDRDKLMALISQAGGLERLGIYPAYSNLNNTNYHRTTIQAPQTTTNIKCRRAGMRAWACICYGWSVICFIIAMCGMSENDRELIGTGVGEGIFSIVLGIMFSVVARSPKGNPCVKLFGKSMPKTLFVILCVAIAVASFIVLAETTR